MRHTKETECPECKTEFGRLRQEKHSGDCSRYVCRRCKVYRVEKCEKCGASVLP
jgi:transposase-like protein